MEWQGAGAKAQFWIVLSQVIHPRMYNLFKNLLVNELLFSSKTSNPGVLKVTEKLKICKQWLK